MAGGETKASKMVVRESTLLKALDVAVIIAALATIPITVAQLQGIGGTGVLVADWIIWLVFVVDYTGPSRTHVVERAGSWVTEGGFDAVLMDSSESATSRPSSNFGGMT